MPRLQSRPVVRPVDPRLTRLLSQWVILGLLLCIALPAARGYNLWIGWLWYWLLAAPAMALCVLHRARLRAVVQRTLRTLRSPEVRAAHTPKAQARRFAARSRARPLARAA